MMFHRLSRSSIRPTADASPLRRRDLLGCGRALRRGAARAAALLLPGRVPAPPRRRGGLPRHRDALGGGAGRRARAAARRHLARDARAGAPRRGRPPRGGRPGAGRGRGGAAVTGVAMPRAVTRTLLQDLVALTKPRIISLLLVTTIAPMFVAGRPGWALL